MVAALAGTAEKGMRARGAGIFARRGFLRRGIFRGAAEGAITRNYIEMRGEWYRGIIVRRRKLPRLAGKCEIL